MSEEWQDFDNAEIQAVQKQIDEENNAEYGEEQKMNKSEKATKELIRAAEAFAKAAPLSEKNEYTIAYEDLRKAIDKAEGT